MLATVELQKLSVVGNAAKSGYLSTICAQILDRQAGDGLLCHSRHGRLGGTGSGPQISLALIPKCTPRREFPGPVGSFQELEVGKMSPNQKGSCNFWKSEGFAARDPNLPDPTVIGLPQVIEWYWVLINLNAAE